jgi:hypothetical protein
MLEIEFCALMAAFKGLARLDVLAVEEYFRNTFQSRSEVLDAAAERYFETAPNQAKEGRFKHLVCKARELAEKRNQIAHGVLIIIRESAEDHRSLEFAWVPATYDRRKMDEKLLPKYCYTSTEIRAFGNDFQSLMVEVMEFTLFLSDPTSA